MWESNFSLSCDKRFHRVRVIQLWGCRLELKHDLGSFDSVLRVLFSARACSLYPGSFHENRIVNLHNNHENHASILRLCFVGLYRFG